MRVFIYCMIDKYKRDNAYKTNIGNGKGSIDIPENTEKSQ